MQYLTNPGFSDESQKRESVLILRTKLVHAWTRITKDSDELHAWAPDLRTRGKPKYVGV